MFERFLTDALTKTFGHIIDNLDADKVRLSTWDGEIHLEQVNLKRDAFDHYVKDCPVEIAYGRVGKLALKVPWKLVRSQLWRPHQDGHQLKCEVVLAHVNVLITPKRRRRGEPNEASTVSEKCSTEQHLNDTDAEETRELMEKERRTQNLVDAELLKQIAESSHSSSKWKWIQDRLAGILATLSVTIQDIHVRYEDPGNSMGFVWDISSPGPRYRSSFAVGLTLKEFSIQSRRKSDEANGGDNETEESPSKSKSTRVSQKTAAADRLALYWDTASRIMSGRAPLEMANVFDEASAFEQAFDFLNDYSGACNTFRERRSPFPARRTYLLDPFSPVVEFCLVSPANNVGDEAVIAPSVVTASLPPCHITLSRGLMEDVGYLRQSARVWTQVQRSTLSGDAIRRLAELRPQKSPKNDPKGWWAYAYEAVHVVHRNDSQVVHYKGWQKLIRAVILRRRYVELYRDLVLVKESERDSVHQSLVETEHSLSVQEIVQFRIHACRCLLSENVATSTVEEIEDGAVGGLRNSPISSEERYRRFQDIVRTLSRVEANKRLFNLGQDGTIEEQAAGIRNKAASWKVSLVCVELSVQVNDVIDSRRRQRAAPVRVVRAAFSFQQEQELMRDGSWKVKANVNDLIVEDCTAAGNEGLFPNLVRSKAPNQCIIVEISRKRRWHKGFNRGSTTSTSVQVSPLEIVYSTDPVEALSRVFHSVQIDLADDYQRMGARLYEWRQKQKKRLIAALSHKEKVILIDVDIGAPTLLVPEKNALGNPLLVLDLGRMHFSNLDRSQSWHSQNAGEQWTLNLSSVHVQCSRTDNYGSKFGDASLVSNPREQVVEPFSLSFALTTVFQDDNESSVTVHATLPRLVLNLSSSVCHLVLRLKQQWAKRREDVQVTGPPNTIITEAQGASFPVDSKKRDRVESAFLFEFRFAAPFLQLMFEDDVLLQTGATTDYPVGLVDLTFRGLEGGVQSRTGGRQSSRIEWTAKMQSVDVLDLYQGAGKDFSHLLSSMAPEFLESHTHRTSSATEMLSFEYSSEESEHSDGFLSVSFHELYVEWNPETLAAIQVAVRLPVINDVKKQQDIRSDADTFFDAEEDDFFDAESDATSIDSAEISEIGSSRHSSFVDLTQLQHRMQNTIIHRPSVLPQSPINFGTTLAGMSPVQVVSAANITVPSKKPFLISFTLAKVRLNFNKEVRHRRVFVAEMDATSCEILRMPSGGSCTKATIGNLVFSDPASQTSGTLYREILGLKTDSEATTASLLKLEIATKPRSRCYGKTPNDHSNVKIDPVKGTAIGEDLVVRANFSPMRFVYLQQLWFEIIDYFFEGIVGYEVWGSKRPEVVSALAVEPTIQTAEKFSFLSLDIALEAPVVLIPVTYCSTNYLQCDLSSIRVENFYRFLPMRRHTEATVCDIKSLQWFNNCIVKMENWKLRGWTGSRLNLDKSSAVSSELLINWPTGPTSTLNSPKWKVSCTFDNALHLVLLKDDFALFQHLLSLNLGETSRHMAEWEALQELPPASLQKFQDNILVKFGYDKKDGTPTTFDVSVELPEVRLTLKNRSLRDLADVRSSRTCWSYLKLSDLVGKQSLDCSLSIAGIEDDLTKTLLSATNENGASDHDDTVTLTYSSTSKPSGDNNKVLAIGDAQILVHYEAWQSVAHFFQSLPAPDYLSPDEVIQVGDRWYKIGGNLSTDQIADERKPLSWFPTSHTESSFSVEVTKRDPSYGLQMKLRRPRVVLGDSTRQVVLSMEEISFCHDVVGGIVQRNFDLSKIEVRVYEDGIISNLRRVSLIRPWCVSGSISRCNGRSSCRCERHTFEANANILRAQASFSDLVVASNICLDLHRTVKRKMKQGSDISPVPEATSQQPDTETTKLDTVPPLRTSKIGLKGLVLNVVDDSGRHFADSQELVRLELFDVAFHEDHVTDEHLESPTKAVLQRRVFLRTLGLIDCLQSSGSPFRSLLHYDDSEKVSTTPECTVRKPAIQLHYRIASDNKNIEVFSKSLFIQYNPSIIIALQRFLGRLRKEIELKDSDSLELSSSGPEGEPHESDMTLDENQSTLRATIHLDCITTTLNKEHQGRSLAKFVVRDGTLDLARTGSGLCVSGKVAGIMVNDMDSSRGRVLPQANSSILCSDPGGDFIQFRYQTFRRQKLATEGSTIPPWVQAQLISDSRIDDFLEIKMSSVDFVYLSARSKELVDYLGNGLPGKGMGATTRAAKGFVEQRIEKRSFLQLQMVAPVVTVPVNELRTVGMQFGGDIMLESSVEAGDITVRRSAFSVKRFGALSYGDSTSSHGMSKTASHVMIENLDVNFSVERRPGVLNMNCDVDKLTMCLSYRDYVMCREILRHNVGKHVDKSLWDNLESAWEKETSSLNDGTVYSKEIKYSDNARHVRYGHAGKTPVSSVSHASESSLGVTIGVATFVLRRDDSFQEQSPGYSYDLISMRLVGAELTTNSGADGQQGSMTIKGFDLKDLGEQGRLSRDLATGCVRQISQYSTIVQGYSPPDDKDKQPTQLIVSMDRPARKNDESLTTNASIVVNYLRITALLSPLKETVEFFKFSWPSAAQSIPCDRNSKTGSETHIQEVAEIPATESSTNSISTVRFVLHYPQMVLIADESRLNSKALVLSGLAIVNGSLKQNSALALDKKSYPGNEKIVKADLQNISSFIYSDVSEFLGCSKQTDEIGVALLLPLTLGIDFEEQRVSHLVRKSLGVSVEKVALSVSGEDLQLFSSLQKKLTRKQLESAETRTLPATLKIKFSVTFEEETLGLGLRKEGRFIVIESTDDARVVVGDAILNIGDVDVTDETLSNAVARLQNSPRPLKVKFMGLKTTTRQEASSARRSQQSSLDLSVSLASIDLVDSNVQIIRGQLSGSRLQLRRTDDNFNIVSSLSSSSTVGVDYFNTKADAWEPVVEPSFVSCSVELIENRKNSARDLSIEIGDRASGPILVNATDSCIFVLERAGRRLLKSHQQHTSADSTDTDDVLADAALTFARRQAAHSIVSQASKALSSNIKTPGAQRLSTLTVKNMLPMDLFCQISVNDAGMSVAPGEFCSFELKPDTDSSVRFESGAWSPWYSIQAAAEPTKEFRIIIDRPLKPPLCFNARLEVNEMEQLELHIFAELWLLNTTDLEICFGAPTDSLFPASFSVNSAEAEVTAAEAALKEISALFDTGEEFPIADEAHGSMNQEILPLPHQTGAFVIEEIFEYIKVAESLVRRRWWAGEYASSTTSAKEEETRKSEDLLEASWIVDTTGDTMDGWESAANLSDFRRSFSPEHKYRRRRFFRKQWIDKHLVNGIYQPIPDSGTSEGNEKQADNSDTFTVAIQVGGGKWSATNIPRHGRVYGAMRISSHRWSTMPSGIFEICYSISPLDGAWGEFSRLLLVSSRFHLRNASDVMAFDVKQNGEHESESTVLRIEPGEAKPFHWTSSSLPELICVRPYEMKDGQPRYMWSGGFDPLTIGAVPLRVRCTHPNDDTEVTTLRMEAELRPKSGGTGINISFVEEYVESGRSLFRIENLSPFKLWITQDGVISRGHGAHDGDLIEPSGSCSFGLDIPFRQGKYANRKAASMDELIRLRLTLAPQASREGIETIKVLQFTSAGATVRLNPSKLRILTTEMRIALQSVRILGVVFNDGPTRVLRLSLIRRLDNAPAFGNPFTDGMGMPPSASASAAKFVKDIYDSAAEAHKQMASGWLPMEEEVVAGSLTTPDSSLRQSILGSPLEETLTNTTIVSFRLAFSGFVLSVVDSVPSEITVMAFRNINAIASWNTPRTKDSTVYVTVEDFQVDNMIPNAPYPIAVCKANVESDGNSEDGPAPLLVIGLSFAPVHKSGIICLKSVTVAPRNLAVRVDLAFLVRLQKFALDARSHFQAHNQEEVQQIDLPDLEKKVKEAEAATSAGGDNQKFYFGGLTILPCNIMLSVAPARALTRAQAMLEGEEAAAIHQAVRKGDLKLGVDSAILGVKIGSRNKTALAVARGVLKSIVVDALLRLDGASLNFAGVFLRNHVSTVPQLATHIGAHYLSSLRQNVPALLASMAAFGNPLGLVRGLGDGVSDFVLEPVKGFQRSVQELDASYLVDGVARGTVSLARHTVGGFANSAASLTETFSKNMTVLTLDRRYAQKRDRGENLRNMEDVNVALGLGSGVQKLVQGFLDGVTGVVRAPIRGANKRGVEGFAKGIGKGLLGLLVKPVIGISDGITDFMIGVKASIDGAAGPHARKNAQTQIRPRRAIVGRHRVLRQYNLADAAAQALISRTPKLAGEKYLGHVDMGDRVALFGDRRMVLLSPSGTEQLVLKYKHVDSLETRRIQFEDGSDGWCVIILLNTRRENNADMEVVTCKDENHIIELRRLLDLAMRNAEEEASSQL